MKHSSLLKALDKIKAEVKQKSISTAYYADNENKEISWYNQDGHVICLHVVRLTDHADPMTDYFPGSFYHTIKSAIEAFNGQRGW